MKKLIVIALAVVMALSVVALTACSNEEVVEGEYSYENSWTPGQKYGCHVKVTISKGVIAKLEVTEDTDTFYNVSSGWESKQTWLDGKDALISSFVGLKVDDINKITVAKNADSANGPVGQPTAITGAPAALKVVAGATQSSGRLILAVQDALSHLGAAA